MVLRSWFARSEPAAGAPGVRALAVSREEWRQLTQDLAAAGGRLLAMWSGAPTGDAVTIHAAFFAAPQALVLTLPVEDATQPYPGLEELFPAAARMQRAIADLAGVRSSDPDTRPWLRHAAWPPAFRPLTRATGPATTAEPAVEGYQFVQVEGDGVHEIPVGPVHAGIIEPGHFRFSVVGEKVLRPRGTPRVHAQGNRTALHRAAATWRVTGSPRGCRATPQLPSPGPTARHSRAWPAPRFRRAR